MDNVFKQKINVQFQKKLPFVAYVLPNDNKCQAIFQKDDTLHLWEQSEVSGFVFHPFHQGHSLIIPLAQATFLEVECGLGLTQSFVTTPNFLSTESQHHFEDLVKKAQIGIQKSAFEKVVLSRVEEIPYELNDLAEIFATLSNQYPTAFRYCFYHPKAGLWLGATPEQFLKSKDNVIETVALAGTQLVKDGFSAVWTSKEKEEQQYVTDYILNQLGSFLNDSEVSAPYSHQAGKLWHIKTTIKATLKPHHNILQVIDQLHPTPAVCGYPKQEALNFILQNEGYERSYYTGFMGIWNYDDDFKVKNTTNLFVNLRCMEYQDQVFRVYVGCGITAASVARDEFVETVNKSNTMKNIILK